ncbi:polysaccharide biosynthesis tyrosine autokinase [Aquimarina sp. 2201CG1-2-11]|uniref:GumC family protein n=1 Tax=Aquimarina discodermiae TaxID=3231043 RepID=UPI003462980B
MDYQYEKDKNNLAFKDQLQAYLRYWKLFLLSTIICLVLAYLYLKYTPVQYKVAATILVKGEKAGILSELSAFEDLSIVESSNKEVENEIEVLKSRPLFENVIKKLNANYVYYAKTNLSKRTVELYKNRPFTALFVKDSLLLDEAAEFVITINSKNKFTLVENAHDYKVEGTFGKVVTTRIGNLILAKNRKPKFFDSFVNRDVYLSISTISTAVENYKASVSVGLVSKDADVISLRMNTSNTEKAKDVLNQLIEEYNIDAVRDKNQIYENTADFIRERLAIINSELSDIEQGVEVFKTSNKLTDVSTETELFLANSSENKKGVGDTYTQLGLVDFMNDYLHKNTEGLLPVNLGFSDVAIVQIISKYNEISLKRDEVLKGTTLKNPMVISLNEKLGSLKISLKQSLSNQKTALKIKLRDLERQDAMMNEKIASLPKKERELRDIVRQQEIKETLYLYLLQKREETAISLAATVANAKIIEKAYASKSPVKPKKRIIVLVALMGAIFIPVLLLFLKDLIDVKVKGRKELENILDIPIVAEIPRTDVKNNFIISTDDRSVVAEAFRIFESNINFLLSDSTQENKVILVTSSSTGEGKTFTSTNLAISLTEPEKKVALLGLDLRSPKILEYLGVNDTLGITNYIRDHELSLDDITINLEDSPGLDILNSGIVPPNPIEILKSKRFKELMEILKNKYDYIIIDTPPISLVADALLLSEYTDLCIYIVRSGFSDKRQLPVAQNLYKDKRFPSMAILLNEVTLSNGSYYGYYGYGYGLNNSEETPKPWWKFFT